MHHCLSWADTSFDWKPMSRPSILTANHTLFWLDAWPVQVINNFAHDGHAHVPFGGSGNAIQCVGQLYISPPSQTQTICD